MEKADPLNDHLRAFIESINASLRDGFKGGDSFTVYVVDDDALDDEEMAGLITNDDGVSLFNEDPGSYPIDMNTRNSTAREAMLWYAIQMHHEYVQELVDSVWMTEHERAMIKSQAPWVTLPSEEDNAKRRKPSKDSER